MPARTAVLPLAAKVATGPAPQSETAHPRTDPQPRAQLTDSRCHQWSQAEKSLSDVRERQQKAFVACTSSLESPSSAHGLKLPAQPPPHPPTPTAKQPATASPEYIGMLI